MLMKRKENILQSWAYNQIIYEDRSQFAAWRKASCGWIRANTVV